MDSDSFMKLVADNDGFEFVIMSEHIITALGQICIMSPRAIILKRAKLSRRARPLQKLWIAPIFIRKKLSAKKELKLKKTAMNHI